MRTLFLSLALLVSVAPAAAQADLWCQQYDFRAGQMSWQLSYNGEYGQYVAGEGFKVTNVHSSSHALSRSIRVHLDGSFTLTKISFLFELPMFTEIRLDYDSAVTGAATSDVFRVAAATDLTLAVNSEAVTDRLGVEVTTEDVSAGWMLTTLAAIKLCGTGTPAPGGAVGSIGIDLPVAQIYTAIATANASTNAASSSLYAPDGSPILPQENGTLLFGYIKWIISPATASELFGPFAPVFQHLGLGLTIMFVMIALYVLIYIAVYIARFAVWLFAWFLKLLDIILQIIQAGAGIVINAARAVLSFVGVRA